MDVSFVRFPLRVTEGSVNCAEHARGYIMLSSLEKGKKGRQGT